MALCRWDFTDRTRNIVSCLEHKNEREILKPQTRKDVLGKLVEAGIWAGPRIEEEDMSEQGTEKGKLVTVSEKPLPQPVKEETGLIAYKTPEGQDVAVSIPMFQRMLCKDANTDQAHYMLNWCAHNRIDPFANEAWFSIMDNKPVIQVSKDAWFRRMERHPQLDYYDSGIIVVMSMNELKNAVIGGMAKDYLVPDKVKEKLLQDALEGKALDPKWFPSRIVVQKRGQYVAPDETLDGAWALIKRKDRPHPIDFKINVDGWEGKKQNGEDNVFWTKKRPFMIWKTAMKNCVRLAFPELSGLLAQRDANEEFDPAGMADHELRQTEQQRTRLIRQLHAVGLQLPKPGPFHHDQLHTIAGSLFDGRGISELSVDELTLFLTTLTEAKENSDVLGDLAAITGSAQTQNQNEREAIIDVDLTSGEPIAAC